jgi:hypothetical protein
LQLYDDVLASLKKILAECEDRVCHCGKHGHALNSVNCPIHGNALKLKRARDLANWEI